MKPVFVEGEDCTFEEKQCDDKKCFCVDKKTGALKDEKFVIPLDETYDCSSKFILTVCQWN